MFSLWSPVVGLCLFIFIESSRPLPDITPEIPMLDKLLHVIVWTALGFLFFRAYANSTKDALSNLNETKRWQTKKLIWISFISATLYGISDEIHQYFVPMRSADIFDVFADVIGSICGVVCGARWYRIFRPRYRVKGQSATHSSPDHIH